MSDVLLLVAAAIVVLSVVPMLVTLRLCFIRGQKWYFSLPCLFLSWPGVWFGYRYMPT